MAFDPSSEDKEKFISFVNSSPTFDGGYHTDRLRFPLDKVKQVYTEFRTGSKFKDEEVDEKGFLFRTLGQNGLGAAATC